MGFKRHLKSTIYRCEHCGCLFNDYEEKIIYRIDKQDKLKQCNTMVVCKECQQIELEDLKIRKENIGNISRYLSLKGKVYRTRKKYESE